MSICEFEKILYGITYVTATKIKMRNPDIDLQNIRKTEQAYVYELFETLWPKLKGLQALV